MDLASAVDAVEVKLLRARIMSCAYGVAPEDRAFCADLVARAGGDWAAFALAPEDAARLDLISAGYLRAVIGGPQGQAVEGCSDAE